MDKEFIFREAIWSTEGNGEVRCSNISVPCGFRLAQLPNGKLSVVGMLDEPACRKLQTILQKARVQCHVKGHDENRTEISINGVDVSHLSYDHANQQGTLTGYAETVELHTETTARVSRVEADLAGFLKPISNPLAIRVNSIHGEFRKQSWGHGTSLRDHGHAYDHMVVDACLRLHLDSGTAQDDVSQLCDNIAFLLAIANRGYVFVTGLHAFDSENRAISCTFKHPPFSARGWSQPLIGHTDLPTFVEQSYPSLSSKYKDWNLGSAFDHYMRAMSARSAWPFAVSIFAAIESMKSAFLSNISDKGREKYFVPRDDFASNSELMTQITALLAETFPEYASLKIDDAQYLNRQILRLNEKPWTFREQLKDMLDHLQVEYASSEIKSINSLRNSVIHTGSGISKKKQGDEFLKNAISAWAKIMDTTNLFERALLVVLEYSGKRNPFNQHQ